MVRYICAIFIASLPLLCFAYHCYVTCVASDRDGEKLIELISSQTYFVSNIFVGISIATCFAIASEMFEVQKNINIPYTYYAEAELVAKNTTTVFKVTDNDNKVTYYETDISLNIADNGNYKNNYMLLMSDNTTREDKTDDIILAVYNAVGEIENK